LAGKGQTGEQGPASINPLGLPALSGIGQ